MNEVVITKVSKHLRGKGARDGVNMYTVVHGSGSKRISETRHMTAEGAEQLKKQLKG